MMDMFDLHRALLRWVQIVLGLLTAFGLLVGLAGLATGRLHREPPARDGHSTAARPAATERNSRPP
jgi:hypothetical protein